MSSPAPVPTIPTPKTRSASGSNRARKTASWPLHTKLMTLPRWKKDPAYLELGIRAFVGVPLRELGKVIGVVCVEHSEAKNFTRQDVALVEAVAGLIGKTLEVEALRHELRLVATDLDTGEAVNFGEPGFDPSRPKYYVLDMFPYPSGAGLHVGHPEGYGFLVPDDGVGTDLYLPAHEMRMVLHGDRCAARVTGTDRRGRREGA